MHLKRNPHTNIHTRVTHQANNSPHHPAALEKDRLLPTLQTLQLKCTLAQPHDMVHGCQLYRCEAQYAGLQDLPSSPFSTDQSDHNTIQRHSIQPLLKCALLPLSQATARPNSDILQPGALCAACCSLTIRSSVCRMPWAWFRAPAAQVTRPCPKHAHRHNMPDGLCIL